MAQRTTSRINLEEWPIDIEWPFVQAVNDGTGSLGRSCTVYWDSRDKGVNLGHYTMPCRFYAVFADPAPCWLEIRIRDGVPECVSFFAGGAKDETLPPLGKFPLQKLVEHAAQLAGRTRVRGEFRPALGSHGPKLLKELARVKSQRGVPVPDELLERISAKYRLAVASGSRSPTKDIAQEENYARSTVAKWVMEARRRGLLGAAEPGRAGELTKGAKRGKRH